MRGQPTDSGRYDKTIRALSIAAVVLTVLLVVTIILGARWWALEEQKLSTEKINRLKKELEMCRAEK
jgi:uncharacterized membrane protein affecting hemolysin expression